MHLLTHFERTQRVKPLYTWRITQRLPNHLARGTASINQFSYRIGDKLPSRANDHECDQRCR